MVYHTSAREYHAFKMNGLSSVLERLMVLWFCTKSACLLKVVQMSMIFVNLQLLEISNRNYSNS